MLKLRYELFLLFELLNGVLTGLVNLGVNVTQTPAQIEVMHRFGKIFETY